MPASGEQTGLGDHHRTARQEDNDACEVECGVRQEDDDPMATIRAVADLITSVLQCTCKVLFIEQSSNRSVQVHMQVIHHMHSVMRRDH